MVGGNVLRLGVVDGRADVPVKADPQKATGVKDLLFGGLPAVLLVDPREQAGGRFARRHQDFRSLAAN